MSIVLLIRSLNFGGAERQLVELAKGLVRRGHTVVVVVFYSEGKFFDELHDAGVRVEQLAKRGRWDVVSFIARLIRVVRRHRPQVLYAFMIEPSLLATLLKPFLPSTRIVWGVRVSNIDFSRYDWFPGLTFRVSRSLARFADLIIANSWAGATHHQELGYPAAVMAVVPNGVDLQRFRPDAAAGRRQRAEWGLSPEVPVIGIVGRLDPMKDHVTFLRAARLLLAMEPQPWFVCVGEGPQSYLAILKQQAAALGVADRVRWVGGQKDMMAVYNGLSVFCLCSAYGEGFSNALAEAMACDVPCIATDVGDAARILEGCAPVVPPRDPVRLAAGIKDVLARSATGKRGVYREQVVQRFSAQRMVTETEGLLRKCVDGA